MYIIFAYHIEHEISNDMNLYLIPGQYVMLHSWCMSRPYTPITWTQKNLVLLIKVYKQGEFSTHLKNTTLGSTIDIRGPYGDFIYKSNRYVNNTCTLQLKKKTVSHMILCVLVFNRLSCSVLAQG